MILHRDIISSRNNPTVKWAASLASKKDRVSLGAFLAEGEKLTLEALDSSLPVTHIFVCEDILPRFLKLLEQRCPSPLYADLSVLVVKKNVLEKISTENAPQGVISVIKHLDFFRQLDIIYKEEFLQNPHERYMILCSVRDPGNLGSVIRSAVAFGVGSVILSSDCADLYNPKTVRGAMGSLFRVKCTVVDDLRSTVEQIKASGRRVFAAELSEGAISVSDVGVLQEDVFIIGNEGHGIPREISEACSGSVYIPISSKTESLNASVAAAVFMWEQSKIGRN